MPYLSASAVVFHCEEALYLMYTFTFTFNVTTIDQRSTQVYPLLNGAVQMADADSQRIQYKVLMRIFGQNPRSDVD